MAGSPALKHGRAMKPGVGEHPIVNGFVGSGREISEKVVALLQTGAREVMTMTREQWNMQPAVTACLKLSATAA
jgi:hypothetical protein